jgi:hypothetical protein
MNTPLHTYSGVSPEQIRLLMRAARVERAQAVRRALQRLFHRRREAQAWPAQNQAFTVHC